MPYIASQHRQKLDPLIDQLAQQIALESQALHSDGAFAGLLNYTCTRLALKVVRQQFGPIRYWLIAMLTGIFKNIADEFYRRVAIPYENQQRESSGDVDLFQEYDQDNNAPDKVSWPR